MMITNNPPMVGNYPVTGSHMPLSVDADAFRWTNPISVSGLALVAFLGLMIALMAF